MACDWLVAWNITWQFINKMIHEFDRYVTNCLTSPTIIPILPFFLIWQLRSLISRCTADAYSIARTRTDSVTAMACLLSWPADYQVAHIPAKLCEAWHISATSAGREERMIDIPGSRMKFAKGRCRILYTRSRICTMNWPGKEPHCDTRGGHTHIPWWKYQCTSDRQTSKKTWILVGIPSLKASEKMWVWYALMNLTTLLWFPWWKCNMDRPGEFVEFSKRPSRTSNAMVSINQKWGITGSQERECESAKQLHHISSQYFQKLVVIIVYMCLVSFFSLGSLDGTPIEQDPRVLLTLQVTAFLFNIGKDADEANQRPGLLSLPFSWGCTYTMFLQIKI